MTDHNHENDGCVVCAGGDHIANEDRLITEHGNAVTMVMAGDDTPGFSYSIGLSEKGMADIIFVGFGSPASGGFVNSLARFQMDGGVLPRGIVPTQHPANPYNVPIWLLEAEDKLGSHAFGVGNRQWRIGSDKPARLVQVTFPDPNGRFPWEPGYDWVDQQAVAPINAGSC